MKGKVLIVGAGSVGNVVAKKCAMLPNVFKEIMLASRTIEKCERIASEITDRDIATAQVDAYDKAALIALIRDFEPDLLIHVALPYQNLVIMEACLETGTNYLDTANYESEDDPQFRYKEQWEMQDRFADAGIMALLGCGFDPGVTSIYTAYAAKHHFDEMEYLDIVDCNAGDHGHAFATNFNPEINIREITQKGKYFENGDWVYTEPHEIKQLVDYPNIGERMSYLLYHEELESLTKNYPSLKRARFWMTFGEEYLTHLRVLQNVGMTGIEPVTYEGVEIVPLKFLKAVLPDPAGLGTNYEGKTCIGCQVKGKKDGEDRIYFVYNNCDHGEVYKEVGAQAVGYTTGVPAMIGAKMILEGTWSGTGVFNVEDFDPDPFMDDLNVYGLPWKEFHGKQLVED